MATEHLGERVAVLGSGNTGTMFAWLAARKIRDLPHYQHKIKWWVFEEVIDGEKLSDLINSNHENVKYLPGKILHKLVEAVTNLEVAIAGATVVIFAIPPQFIRRLLPTIKNKLHPQVKILNVMEGVSFDQGAFTPYSSIFRSEGQIQASVLGGAFQVQNLEAGEHCEGTIGCEKLETGLVFKELLESPEFRINVVEDVVGVEMCGILNTAVAIGAGVVDSLDTSQVSKSLYLRKAFKEIEQLCQRFFPSIKASTLLESCGIGDLISKAYGGRNRRCGEVFARTGKKWQEIEKELLSGQVLQGSKIVKQLRDFLDKNEATKDFPCLSKISKVSFEGENPMVLISS